MTTISISNSFAYSNKFSEVKVGKPQGGISLFLKNSHFGLCGHRMERTRAEVGMIQKIQIKESSKILTLEEDSDKGIGIEG